MKETLELVDKLQSNLDDAKVQPVDIEGQLRARKKSSALLKEKVKMLEAQAIGAQTFAARVIELEQELKDTMNHRGEMFVEGQDSVKKVLIKRFP